MMRDPLRHLYHCWCSGIGLRQSLRCIRRTCGVDFDFEDARLHFVRWSVEG